MGFFRRWRHLVEYIWCQYHPVPARCIIGIHPLSKNGNPDRWVRHLSMFSLFEYHSDYRYSTADGLDQLYGYAVLFDADGCAVGDLDGHGGLHGWIIFIIPCGIEYQHIDGSDHAICEHRWHVHGDVHRACIGRLRCGDGDGHSGSNGLADGDDQLCGNAILFDADDKSVGDVDGYGGIHGWIL